jgi:hypothetical protein
VATSHEADFAVTVGLVTMMAPTAPAMKNNTAQTCSSRPRQNRYTPGLLGGQAAAEVALDGGERQVDDSAVEEGDR